MPDTVEARLEGYAHGVCYTKPWKGDDQVEMPFHCTIAMCKYMREHRYDDIRDRKPEPIRRQPAAVERLSSDFLNSHSS